MPGAGLQQAGPGTTPQGTVPLGHKETPVHCLECPQQQLQQAVLAAQDVQQVLLVGVILHLKSWVVCPLLLPLQLAAGAPGGLTEVGGGAWVEVGS